MGKPNKQKNTAPVVAETPAVDETLADALGLDVAELTEIEAAADAAVVEPETDEAPEADVVADEVQSDEQPETDTVGDEAPAETFADDIVTDASGAPRFKRRAPTMLEDTALKTKPRTKVATKSNKRIADNSNEGGAHANARYLSFPTDKWGVTKDVKKAMVSMASRIGGDPSKYKLAVQTLDILREHMDMKFDADKAYRQSLTVQPTAE